MSRPDLAKIQDVGAALRKRAIFFWDNDPSDLSKDDFNTIASYLQNLADSIDEAVKGNRGKSLVRGFTAFVLYVLLFGVLCYLFYTYSPYEDKYYAKLAREIFSNPDTQMYVFYFRGGVALFLSLFVFFISVFFSIIVCAFAKLAAPRFVNAVVEAFVTVLLAGGAYYAYHEYVFTQGLAKTLL